MAQGVDSSESEAMGQFASGGISGGASAAISLDPSGVGQREQTGFVRALSLPWRMLVAMYRDPRLIFGVVLVALALAALFAPTISPFDPLDVHASAVAEAPSQLHRLGTDSAGRDILSRVIYGTRISLSVGLASILIGGGLGTLLGIVGGFIGGWTDRLISVAMDALLAFPDLILALAIAAVVGAGVSDFVVSLGIPFTPAVTHIPINATVVRMASLVVALAVVRIPVYARLARAQTLQIRALQYVEAAHAGGTPTLKLLRRHVLPNIFSPLLVQATISISFAILAESTLSFLGLGAPPPTPEWGAMIAEAQPYLVGSDPWMILGPGLALVITVLSLNLFGDALRDKLDPRHADRALRVRPGAQ